MPALLDLVRVTSTTIGTGPLTLGSAVQGFLTETQAGAVDQQIYSYAIEGSYVAAGDEFVASARETGIGAYTASSRTLTRTVQFSTNSNALLNLTGDQQVIITSLRSSFLEQLTADRDYYVRTDGSDSNSGLVNTAGGAWLTLQHAYDWVCANLQQNGFTVTVNIGSGTFSAGIDTTSSGLEPNGPLQFDGAGLASTTIQNGTADAAVFYIFMNLHGPMITFSNMKIQKSGGTNGTLLYAIQMATIGFYNIDFGTAGTGNHIDCRSFSKIYCIGDYQVSGNAGNHLYCLNGGYIDFIAPTVTISASITVGWVWCQTNSIISAYSVTYSLGAFTVTGTRYAVGDAGIVNTFGGGANYFPGTVAGSANGANFALYI